MSVGVSGPRDSRQTSSLLSGGEEKTTDKALVRILDICFALSGLAALFLPIAILGLAVRSTSAGPAFFRQTRIGRSERPFVCVKLRTMSHGTPQAGTHEISQAQVTPLGNFLRRTKLDELPQLWNVLIGEMSLVGPRPCLPMQSELIEERRQRAVFRVRPGITGPGQIEGVDMSRPVELAQIDEQWALDPNVVSYVRLIALTLIGKGQGDRVRG